MAHDEYVDNVIYVKLEVSFYINWFHVIDSCVVGGYWWTTSHLLYWTNIVYKDTNIKHYEGK